MEPAETSRHSSSVSDVEEDYKSEEEDKIDFNRIKRSSFIMPGKHMPLPELSRQESDTKMSKTGVNVFVRFRPDVTVEEEVGLPCVTYMPNGKEIDINHESRSYNYKFRRILPPESTQEQVFLSCALPLIDSILNGFNSAIIGYGQTGSGKTHTLLGPGYDRPESIGKTDPELRGMAPRLIQSVFHQIFSSFAPDIVYKLYVSYIHIYNEKIKDLLNSAKSSLKVYQDLQHGLWITDATRVPAKNVDEVLKILELGTRLRVTAATNSNATSSRSHAILILTIKKKLVLQGLKRKSQVYITDLCGSERISKTGAAAERLTEAQNINKSLLALGNVVAALAEKRKYIPYRDSKITRILQNSFGGNSLTSLILCCSSNSTNALETLSTLRFGARASLVENKPMANEHHSIHDLKRMLNEANSKIISQQRVIRSQNEKMFQMEAIMTELYTMVGMRNLETIEKKFQVNMSSLKTSPMVKLNVNLFGNIVHFLHPVEVIKLFWVCKHFYTMLKNDKVWIYFLTQLKQGEVHLCHVEPDEWPNHSEITGSYWEAIFTVVKRNILSRMPARRMESSSSQSGLRLFVNKNS